MHLRRVAGILLLVLSLLSLSALRTLPFVVAISIVRVQGNANGTATTGASTLAVTLASIPTQNNSLVLTYAEGEASGAIITVSSVSETGATWTKQVASSHAQGSYGTDSEIWVGVVTCSPSCSKSITVNLSASIGLNSGPAIADVCEYSGLKTSGFLDKTASNNGNAGSTDTGTTATTSMASELLIGAVAVASGVSAGQSTPTNSFTLLDGAATSGGAGYISNAFLESIVGSTQTANSGTSTSNPGAWDGVIATFEAIVLPSANISDSFGQSDSLGTRFIGSRGVSDVASLADLFSGKITGRFVSDIQSLTDSVKGETPLNNRILSDTLSITDSLAYLWHQSGAHSHFNPAPFIDTVNLVDSFNKLYVGHISISDLNQIADTLTGQRNVPISINEIILIVDGVGRIGPPHVPSSITAAQNGQNPENAVNLSWSESDSYTGMTYTIQHSTDQITWSVVGSSSTTTFTDSGLSAGTAYYYSIKACNGQVPLGCSPFSGVPYAFVVTSSGTPGSGGGAGPIPNPTYYNLVVKVQDSNGNPLSGASVSAGTQSLLTDVNGLANFGEVQSGSYLIGAQAASCNGGNETITLSSDHPTSNPVSLSLSCGAAAAGGTLSFSQTEQLITLIVGLALLGMAVVGIIKYQSDKKKKSRSAY